MSEAKVAYLPARRARLVVGVLILLCIGAVAPAASGQEPGVIYEPGSPSDKEYAIPLEEARRDASGAGTSADERPAFGVGITRRGGGGPGTGRGGGEGAGAEDGAGGTGGGADRSDSAGLGKRLEEAESADAPALWMLALLLLVLLPALLVGMMVARRGGQQPAS